MIIAAFGFVSTIYYYPLFFVNFFFFGLSSSWSLFSDFSIIYESVLLIILYCIIALRFVLLCEYEYWCLSSIQNLFQPSPLWILSHSYFLSSLYMTAQLGICDILSFYPPHLLKFLSYFLAVSLFCILCIFFRSFISKKIPFQLCFLCCITHKMNFNFHFLFFLNLSNYYLVLFSNVCLLLVFVLAIF